MIFFTQKIEPFKCQNSGMMLSPTPCKLQDDREGFYFSIDKWNDQLIAKGAVIEQITVDDFKIEEFNS